MDTITITNPTRRRSWGWNYSTQPGGAGTYDILPPAKPGYVGTIGQVRGDIRNDRNYASFRQGGTHLASAWFYGSQRVLKVRYLDTWMSMTDALNLGLFDPQAPFYAEYSKSVTVQVIDNA